MAKKYKFVDLKDVNNILTSSPGEIKMMKKPLEAEQVAVTYRLMPPKTGAKGGRGHKHKTQEEVVFVFAGKLEVKVDDEIIELTPKTAIRISPSAAQGMWNNGPEDVELLIISRYSEDLMDDVEFVSDFWPE